MFNKKFFVGLATVISSISIGSYFYFNSDDPPPTPPNPKPSTKSIKTPEKVIGFVDFIRLKSSVPSLDQLSSLESERKRIQLELELVMKPVIISPPKVDDKPFNDSVWQKNAQNIVSQAAELERRKKQFAEDYRKSSEPDYIKRRDEIIGEYYNEVLNIKLKLQNADNMRLSDEQIEAFNQRLEEIKVERNQKQLELMNEWIADIAKHAEESVKVEEEALKIQAKESVEKVKLEAQLAKESAIKRNEQLMKQAMDQSVARQKRRLELKDHLQDVITKYDALESQIFDSISDKASELAVINKCSHIFMNSANPDYKLGHGGRVFNINALDLTDDLINLLKEVN